MRVLLLPTSMSAFTCLSWLVTASDSRRVLIRSTVEQQGRGSISLYVLVLIITTINHVHLVEHERPPTLLLSPDPAFPSERLPDANVRLGV